MEIEYDNVKRLKTLQARGLDFGDVAAIEWETALTAADDRASYGEQRYVTIGFIHGRLCVVVWTLRGEKLRVISLRKANAREVSRYERT